MSQYSGIETKFQQLASTMRIVIQLLEDIESEVSQIQPGSAPGAPPPPPPPGSFAPGVDAATASSSPWGYASGPYTPLPPMPQWVWPAFGAGYPWMGWPLMPMQAWGGNWMWGAPPQGAPHTGGRPAAPTRWSWSWDTTRPPYGAEPPARDPRTAP